MSIHLNLENLKKDSDCNNAELHWMPCAIKSDGQAKVSKYFQPIVKETKDKVLQASFRGHPLLGKEVTLPRSYTGVVLQQINEKLNEEAEKNLYGCHAFNKFTYWNWDIEPSENDKIITAFEWLEVSKISSINGFFCCNTNEVTMAGTPCVVAPPPAKKT